MDRCYPYHISLFMVYSQMCIKVTCTYTFTLYLVTQAILSKIIPYFYIKLYNSIDEQEKADSDTNSSTFEQSFIQLV